MQNDTITSIIELKKSSKMGLESKSNYSIYPIVTNVFSQRKKKINGEGKIRCICLVK